MPLAETRELVEGVPEQVLVARASPVEAAAAAMEKDGPKPKQQRVAPESSAAPRPRFEGRRVLVTGGAQGIGRQIAEDQGSQGCHFGMDKGG